MRLMQCHILSTDVYVLPRGRGAIIVEATNFRKVAMEANLHEHSISGVEIESEKVCPIEAQVNLYGQL